MYYHRYPFALGCILTCSLLLAGCAVHPSARTTQTTSALQTVETGISSYSGRMILHIEQQTVQSFAVDFQLTGNADNGTLHFFGPFGSIVAIIDWSPEIATFKKGGRSRSFASLDELLTELIGTQLSSASLLSWLEGKETLAKGWQTDLSEYKLGKISAQRVFPLPVVKLQLILQ